MVLLLRRAAVATAAVVTGFVRAEELCSLTPASYTSAKQAYPDVAFAISEVEKHSIATWYSDRIVNGDYAATARQLVSTCPESSRLSVVVYGLPSKDCEAGYSAAGSRVQNAADYVTFLQTLVDTIKNRKVLYVLEPDAVGLLAKDGGCGESAGYRANLKTAIKMLSANANAEIYLDVGYWTLAWPEPLQRVVETVQDLVSGGGRVKGITLNTSNYRSTVEIQELCSNFQQSIGNSEMNCVADTSRNYRGSPSTEWCNVGAAGIGKPPSSDTGFSNIDYFLWIKPPGESDGQCDGSGHTPDSLHGPEPGEFFFEAFTKLWDQGYFVDALSMPKIAEGGSVIPNPTPAPTPAPTSAPTPAPTSAKTSVPTSFPSQTPDDTSPVQIGVPSTESPFTTTPEPTTKTPLTTTTPSPTTVAPTTNPTPLTLPSMSTPAPVSQSPASQSPAPAITTTPVVTSATPSVTMATPSSPHDSTPTPGVDATASPAIQSPLPTPTSTQLPSPTPMPTLRRPHPKPTPDASRPHPHPTPLVSSPHRPRPTRTPKASASASSDGSLAPSPSSSTDIKQIAPAAVDGGPHSIASNPASSPSGATDTGAMQATTKSGSESHSFAGGVIAAVLTGCVVLAVAAAAFVHVRRRAHNAAADELKTPVGLEPAHPAYLSQL